MAWRDHVGSRSGLRRHGDGRLSATSGILIGLNVRHCRRGEFNYVRANRGFRLYSAVGAIVFTGVQPVVFAYWPE